MKNTDVVARVQAKFYNVAFTLRKLDTLVLEVFLLSWLTPRILWRHQKKTLAFSVYSKCVHVLSSQSDL